MQTDQFPVPLSHVAVFTSTHDCVLCLQEVGHRHRPYHLGDQVMSQEEEWKPKRNQYPYEERGFPPLTLPS